MRNAERDKLRALRRTTGCIGLITLFASLAAPAFSVDPILKLFTIGRVERMPVAALLFYTLASAIRKPLWTLNSPYVFAVLGLPFAASWRWMALGKNAGVGIARRALSLLLLLPWGLPIFWMELRGTPHPPHNSDPVLWGYYLYCVAHTVLFVSVQIAPGVQTPDRHHGFPVITNPPGRA